MTIRKALHILSLVLIVSVCQASMFKMFAPPSAVSAASSDAGKSESVASNGVSSLVAEFPTGELAIQSKRCIQDSVQMVPSRRIMMPSNVDSDNIGQLEHTSLEFLEPYQHGSFPVDFRASGLWSGIKDMVSWDSLLVGGYTSGVAVFARESSGEYRWLSQLYIAEGFGTSIALYQHYVLWSGWNLIVGNLTIVDISDPVHPTLVSSMELGHDAYDVAVSGHYAHVAHRGGFTTVDLSDINHPQIVAERHSPMPANGVVVVVDSVLCLLAGSIFFYDIRDPVQPELIGSVDTEDYPVDAAAIGTLLVVSDGDATWPAARSFLLLVFGWSNFSRRLRLLSLLLDRFSLRFCTPPFRDRRAAR